MNDIPADKVIPNQLSTYEVPYSDRISVLEGDVIGVAISVGTTKDPQLHAHVTSGSTERYATTQFFTYTKLAANGELLDRWLEPRFTYTTTTDPNDRHSYFVSFAADISKQPKGEYIRAGNTKQSVSQLKLQLSFHFVVPFQNILAKRTKKRNFYDLSVTRDHSLRNFFKPSMINTRDANNHR